MYPSFTLRRRRPFFSSRAATLTPEEIRAYPSPSFFPLFYVSRYHFLSFPPFIPLSAFSPLSLSSSLSTPDATNRAPFWWDPPALDCLPRLSFPVVLASRTTEFSRTTKTRRLAIERLARRPLPSSLFARVVDPTRFLSSPMIGKPALISRWKIGGLILSLHPLPLFWLRIIYRSTVIHR